LNDIYSDRQGLKASLLYGGLTISFVRF